jgi:hypothetical protein
LVHQIGNDLGIFICGLLSVTLITVRSTIYCFANHCTVVPGGAVPALGPAEWAALFFRERIDVNVQSR